MERLKPQLGDVLIFGQGPVLPAEPRKKIIMPDTPPTPQALNWWASEISVASVALSSDIQTRTLRIMGGQTMTQEVKECLTEDEKNTWSSEADLIEGKIQAIIVQQQEIDADEGREIATEKEKSSTNTLENLVNICNEQLDPLDPEGPMNDTELDLLGANFHLARMKPLSTIFGILYRRTIGAESMMRYQALRDYAEAEARNDLDGMAKSEAILNDINQRHDVNAAKRTSLNSTEARMDQEAKARGHEVGYYAAREDTDLLTIAEKQADEDVWTRALLTIPEYSMKYFGNVRNNERLRRILRNFDALFPDTDEERGALGKYDITMDDVEQCDLDEVRKKLRSIPRLMPNNYLPEKLRFAAEKGIPFDTVDVIKAWKEEHAARGWPDDVEAKFQQLLASNA